MTRTKIPNSPIAVVGIGCRFPDADDHEAFWQNIATAKTSFRPVPKDRWDHRAFFNPNQRETDKTWTPTGSFIESYREFAALHYGIAPRRLEVMDPQQRLLIEATRIAIQDAGYETRRYDRDRTGVYVGISVSEFKNIAGSRVMAMQLAAGDYGPAAGSQELRDAVLSLADHVVPLRAFSLSGAITALAAAAISQTFDFGGPAYAIDAACASASVAVNDAVVQLRAGLIDQAVAGGVYINLTPDNLVSFTRIGAISPSGACRPFDARADGFVQSDGVGMLFLKRLDDALADGDRIYAVIRGTGCNNDGRGEGPMTPRVEGQLRALRRAYDDAGFSPATVAYFEAHGTATAVGDPVEVEALGTLLLQEGVTPASPAMIGSVKGNIGHAMAAAGIAGLVKAIKVVEKRAAPPQAGFERPHPVLGLDRYPLLVSSEGRELAARDGEPLRVAVSSFGFGGTNSHLVLEEAPKVSRPRIVSRPMAAELSKDASDATEPAARPEALLVTAPNATLLAAHLRELATAISTGAARNSSLADIAFTLNATRRRERIRAVVGARTPDELVGNLSKLAGAIDKSITEQGAEPKFPLVVNPHLVVHDAGGADAEKRKIALLFPGQGAQKTFLFDHLRQRFPRFRSKLAELETGASALLAKPLSSYVYPDASIPAAQAEAELTATEVCQPAMGALGLALASLLEDAGVKADVTLGHSLGEFAALAHAGAIDPVDAVKLVAIRGKAMRDLPLEDTGAMAAVMSDADTVRAAIAGLEGVWVANVNHPRQVSISGTTPGVAAATELLKAHKLDVRPLPVSHAFHTPLLAGIDPTMDRILSSLELRAPSKATVASCIQAEAYGDDVAAMRRTLLAHATSPVNFTRGLEQAAAAGATVFVNVGAAGMLTSFAKATLGDGILPVTLSPAEDDGGYELIRGLAILAAVGIPVNFGVLYEGEGRLPADNLPATPLERESYWIVKDRPQQKSRLDHPLPVAGERPVVHVKGASPVVVGSKDEEMTTKREPAQPAVGAGIVELFREQAAILRQHAEIIAAQNRVLLGEVSAQPVAATPVAQGAPMPQAVAQAPAPAPVRATTSSGPVARVADLMREAPAAKAAATPVTSEPTTPARAAEAPKTELTRVTPEAPKAEVPKVDAVDVAAVRDRVFEIVAKISAFPRQSLRAEQRLVDELGFDSLMVADLGGAIEGVYPNLGGLPQALFSLTTTVGDLAEHVAKKLAKGANSAASTEIPSKSEKSEAKSSESKSEAVAVSRYRVVPQATAPIVGAVKHTPKDEAWLVTEDGSALSAAIAAELERRGAKTVRVRFTKDGVAAADRVAVGSVNLWPESFADGLSAAIARAGVKLSGFVHAAGLAVEASAEATASPVLLLHPIVAGLEVSRVAVITTLGGKLGLEASAAAARHLPQAALLGYTKALARERPSAIVRAVDVDPSTAADVNAAAILDELFGADLALEVGLVGGARFTPTLVPVDGSAAKRRTLTRDDVVLVTGGAGELGSLVAIDVAKKKPKAVVLVGRRARDAEIDKVLAKIISEGARALYVSADVTSAASLKSAVDAATAALGPVTVAIHSAGAIEDAPASKKSLESVRRVMDPKVLGADALLRAFPGLRDLVIFSSWAGRFGNASQTDYSAANDLVDHLAVVGNSGNPGNTRTVAIDWPPWASTAMVRSIPKVIQNAMKAEGVTFLEDAEGLATFHAIFEDGASGIEVVGRAMPRHETRVRAFERFTSEAHPYLADHKLKGRPVVPLASALDLVAWAGASTGSGTLVVEDLELVRGVMGGESALVRATGKVLSDGTGVADVELRAAKEGEVASEASPVAYRAKVVRLPKTDVVLPAWGLEGAPVAASLDLDTFYREHTFHGPKLRGITSVTTVTAKGIGGTVATSSPAAWMPGSARAAWAVDPLVVDGAFQLAGYWSAVHLGKAGFPTGFDKLTLLRPFGDGAVHVTVVLRDVQAETFACSITFEDASGVMIGVLENVRGRFADLVVKPTASAPTHGNGNGNGAHANGGAHEEVKVPEESWKVEMWPEVEALDQRFQMAELVGLSNPYFHMHSGTARNRSIVDGVEMLNFSSYNYLGFSGHPEVVQAAKDAIERYGTSVSASRVASGERPLHRELEAGIAEHLGVEDSIVFVSGHATNVTTVGHLFDRNDLILHDALIHDSVLQGIYLSGATRRPFPHNDLDAAERVLSQVRTNYRRVLLVSEGIYSMDGDVCDLPRLIDLKKRFKTMLMIDEAHSAGVLGHAGKGIGHHFPGVDPKDVDIWMGTLSKSYASCGGYIAGSKTLVRYLKYTAPGFVYSAGITPPNAASALKSLELMKRHPEVVEQLRARSKYFLDLLKARGIDTGHAIGAAVIPAIVGNSLAALKLSENLAKRRINVQPIVYPAVEDDAARLRFFISSTHTEEELLETANILVEELDKVRKSLAEGMNEMSL
ncbi:aminotransferase class I/II-fold pyridoxal phosphate-dependent enzyme [Myxococcota bacterium]|nr:aminotransferase class I/II-fold pyridoxal phosphate-dependent enzyme [Myxococcota bacterium]